MTHSIQLISINEQCVASYLADEKNSERRLVIEQDPRSSTYYLNYRKLSLIEKTEARIGIGRAAFCSIATFFAQHHINIPPCRKISSL